jgi:glyoxalase superfamily protein
MTMPGLPRVAIVASRPSRIATIAIDTRQPSVVADSWCAVLGWRVIDVDEDGISTAPPDSSWPTIDVFSVPEPQTIKNRLHPDLRADGLSTSEEVQRLLDLDAQRVDVGQGPDVSWVVLADGGGVLSAGPSVQGL